MLLKTKNQIQQALINEIRRQIVYSEIEIIWTYGTKWREWQFQGMK